MGYPRSKYVSATEVQVLHCTSRCVRRSFLCGIDPVSGRDYEHRKRWLEKRLLELAECFSVRVLSYAILSNHMHTVIRQEPLAPRSWPDIEVAQKWLRLFPPPKRTGPAYQQRLKAILDDSERLAVLRYRLGSPSWFMRLLKEPLARLANREDECTGHFWEGRFDSTQALDDAAVLSQMVYVDLNPVRAGIASTPANSLYTSIHHRLKRGDDPDALLRPLVGDDRTGLPDITLRDYLDLMHWTAELPLNSQGQPLADIPPPFLALHRFSGAAWKQQVNGTETLFHRFIGSVASLNQCAESIGLRFVWGIGAAKKLLDSS